MEGRTLRAVADAADAERFTGREAELGAMRDLFDRATTSRILYLHGPGGIGKSALLRAAARIAASEGFEVSSFDGRALPGDLGQLIDRILGDDDGSRVVMIDEADALGATLAPLRDGLLDTLPADSRIVFAGRTPPAPEWRDRGSHTILIDLPLTPLDRAAASELLETSGVAAERRDEIIAWAQGSPLALTVAAAVPSGRPGQAEAALEERLTSWLAGRAMLDVDPAVLEVAALARVLDARLISAALPGHATRDAMRRLGELPVIQRLGGRLSLHPVLAAAIRARLRATEPQRYRDLVRRIALQLGSRARLGDIDALIELSLFVEDPRLQPTISNRPSPTHYADALRAGEFAEFTRAGGFDREADGPELAAWDERPPEIDFALRGSDGTALLVNKYVRVDRLPDLGPISSSLAETARRAGVDPERSFAGLSLFADAPAADLVEAARLSSGAFMYRSGMPGLQAILMYFPAPGRHPGDAATLGYEVADAGPRTIAVADLRPGGAVDFVERVVLLELGIERPGTGSADLLAPGDDPEREARLRALLDRVFGGSVDDRRLRAVIELAHLGRRRSEQECLEALHVSRPTWYRLLRRARERVLTAQG